MPNSFGSRLPPELWSLVLENVSRHYRLPLLSVSRLFHDITIGYLFSSVKIFLVGGETAMDMLNATSSEEQWVDDVSERMMRHSWEIMDYVTLNARFARVVKHLTIVSYLEGHAHFERLTLAKAFPFLTNLETFRWIGCHPNFDSTLARPLPRSIETLAVHSFVPWSSLQHLGQVTSLHLPMPFLFPDDEAAHDWYSYDPIIHNASKALTLDGSLSVFPHLKELVTGCQHLVQTPIRVYSQLTDLTLWDFNPNPSANTPIVGLDLLFYHATLLQSLSLVGDFPTTLFSFFPESDSLPLLTSFRLISHHDGGNILEEEVFRLRTFLSGRQTLQRFFFRYTGLFKHHALEIFETVAGLKGLRVLGFHTGFQALFDDDLQFILPNISPDLQALHLGLFWCGSTLLPLVDRIGQFPHLSFLHLYSAAGRLPILVLDLAAENPNLEMIGLNRALWELIREDGVVELEKWPRWKIKYSVEEEFLHPDHAWLFKYN